MLRFTLHARPALLLSLTVIERLLLGNGRTFSIHATQVIMHVGSVATDQRLRCMPVICTVAERVHLTRTGCRGGTCPHSLYHAAASGVRQRHTC